MALLRPTSWACRTRSSRFRTPLRSRGFLATVGPEHDGWVVRLESDNSWRVYNAAGAGGAGSFDPYDPPSGMGVPYALTIVQPAGGTLVAAGQAQLVRVYSGDAPPHDAVALQRLDTAGQWADEGELVQAADAAFWSAMITFSSGDVAIRAVARLAGAIVALSPAQPIVLATTGPSVRLVLPTPSALQAAVNAGGGAAAFVAEAEVTDPTYDLASTVIEQQDGQSWVIIAEATPAQIAAATDAQEPLTVTSSQIVAASGDRVVLRAVATDLAGNTASVQAEVVVPAQTVAENAYRLAADVAADITAVGLAPADEGTDLVRLASGTVVTATGTAAARTLRYDSGAVLDEAGQDEAIVSALRIHGTAQELTVPAGFQPARLVSAGVEALGPSGRSVLPLAADVAYEGSPVINLQPGALDVVVALAMDPATYEEVLASGDVLAVFPDGELEQLGIVIEWQGVHAVKVRAGDGTTKRFDETVTVGSGPLILRVRVDNAGARMRVWQGSSLLAESNREGPYAATVALDRMRVGGGGVGSFVGAYVATGLSEADAVTLYLAMNDQLGLGVDPADIDPAAVLRQDYPEQAEWRPLFASVQESEFALSPRPAPSLLSGSDTASAVDLTQTLLAVAGGEAVRQGVVGFSRPGLYTLQAIESAARRNDERAVMLRDEKAVAHTYGMGAEAASLYALGRAAGEGYEVLPAPLIQNPWAGDRALGLRAVTNVVTAAMERTVYGTFWGDGENLGQVMGELGHTLGYAGDALTEPMRWAAAARALRIARALAARPEKGINTNKTGPALTGLASLNSAARVGCLAGWSRAAELIAACGQAVENLLRHVDEGGVWRAGYPLEGAGPEEDYRKRYQADLGLALMKALPYLEEPAWALLEERFLEVAEGEILQHVANGRGSYDAGAGHTSRTSRGVIGGQQGDVLARWAVGAYLDARSRPYADIRPLPSGAALYDTLLSEVAGLGGQSQHSPWPGLAAAYAAWEAGGSFEEQGDHSSPWGDAYWWNPVQPTGTPRAVATYLAALYAHEVSGTVTAQDLAETAVPSERPAPVQLSAAWPEEGQQGEPWHTLMGFLGADGRRVNVVAETVSNPGGIGYDGSNTGGKVNTLAVYGPGGGTDGGAGVVRLDRTTKGGGRAPSGSEANSAGDQYYEVNRRHSLSHLVPISGTVAYRHFPIVAANAAGQGAAAAGDTITLAGDARPYLRGGVGDVPQALAVFGTLGAPGALKLPDGSIAGASLGERIVAEGGVSYDVALDQTTITVGYAHTSARPVPAGGIVSVGITSRFVDEPVVDVGADYVQTTRQMGGHAATGTFDHAETCYGYARALTGNWPDLPAHAHGIISGAVTEVWRAEKVGDGAGSALLETWTRTADAVAQGETRPRLLCQSALLLDDNNHSALLVEAYVAGDGWTRLDPGQASLAASVVRMSRPDDAPGEYLYATLDAPREVFLMPRFQQPYQTVEEAGSTLCVVVGAEGPEQALLAWSIRWGTADPGLVGQAASASLVEPQAGERVLRGMPLHVRHAEAEGDSPVASRHVERSTDGGATWAAVAVHRIVPETDALGAPTGAYVSIITAPDAASVQLRVRLVLGDASEIASDGVALSMQASDLVLHDDYSLAAGGTSLSDTVRTVDTLAYYENVDPAADDVTSIEVTGGEAAATTAWETAWTDTADTAHAAEARLTLHGNTDEGVAVAGRRDRVHQRSNRVTVGGRVASDATRCVLLGVAAGPATEMQFAGAVGSVVIRAATTGRSVAGYVARLDAGGVEVERRYCGGLIATVQTNPHGAGFDLGGAAGRAGYLKVWRPA